MHRRCAGAAPLIVVAAALAAFAMPAGAQTVNEIRAAQVKSAFLLNFVRYAQWPETAFETPQSPYIIAVVGTDTLGDALDATVAGQRIAGREIVVTRYPLPTADIPAALAEGIGRSHLVFLTEPGAPATAAVAGALAGTHSLTVSDGVGPAGAGAMMALDVDAGRIVFYANPGTIQAASVRISSKVLSLARIVHASRVAETEDSD